MCSSRITRSILQNLEVLYVIFFAIGAIASCKVDGHRSCHLRVRIRTEIRTTQQNGSALRAFCSTHRWAAHGSPCSSRHGRHAEPSEGVPRGGPGRLGGPGAGVPLRSALAPSGATFHKNFVNICMREQLRCKPVFMSSESPVYVLGGAGAGDLVEALRLPGTEVEPHRGGAQLRIPNVPPGSLRTAQACSGACLHSRRSPRRPVV